MKNEQRKQMRKLRNAMSIDEVCEKSAKITQRFLSTSEYKNADTVMLYLSAKNEPDTFNLAERILHDGKKVIVPITNVSDNTLTLSYLESLDALKEGAFGISEPSVVIPCSADEVDLVVVPGLVFDESGGRIGYGKGYYDRFFENTNAVKAAFCYDFQIVGKAATEQHDVAMDIILTESRYIDCDN